MVRRDHCNTVIPQAKRGGKRSLRSLLFIINLNNTIMKYFTFRELMHSNVALQNGIDNDLPLHKDAKVYFNLIALVNNVLDPIRERFAIPIIITSGYRCERLNKLVGGVDNSQHMKGEAVDFYFEGFSRKEMADAFFEIAEDFEFDQLIYYKKKGIIHVSYRRKNNRHQSFMR